MSDEATKLPAGAGPCTDGPCTEAQQHLWDYLDGELSDGDCAKIKAHIEECPPCSEMFENEAKLKEKVHRACGCESAPQALRSRVMSMIAAFKLEACGGSKAEASEQEVSQRP